MYTDIKTQPLMHLQIPHSSQNMEHKFQNPSNYLQHTVLNTIAICTPEHQLIPLYSFRTEYPPVRRSHWMAYNKHRPV